MNSHIIALNIREFISADQPAEDILRAGLCRPAGMVERVGQGGRPTCNCGIESTLTLYRYLKFTCALFDRDQ
jgi:hypothetical protein